MLSDTKNSVISPYGIAAVLSMAAEGASEETLNDLLSGIGVENLDALRALACSVADKYKEAFQSENSIVLQKGGEGVRLLEPFKQTANEYYHAEMREVESSGASSLLLQNIASFKAQWLQKMERDASHEHCFYNADGSKGHPAFLNCAGSMRYYLDGRIGTNAIQAVALPYKLGEEAIPFELILISGESALTERQLRDIISSMSIGNCSVEFPEFSINSEFDLIPMMEAVGIRRIFASKDAFDRMATVPMRADAFIQKAEIRVDRDGTIAKATTRMITCKCIANEPRSESLFFNKPFSYFLRNVDSGDILFLGCVNYLADCERERERYDIAEFFEARRRAQ